jgi:hypothetical protein
MVLTTSATALVLVTTACRVACALVPATLMLARLSLLLREQQLCHLYICLSNFLIGDTPMRLLALMVFKSENISMAHAI